MFHRIFILLFWLWAWSAQADSMRCNNHLIIDGDPIALLVLHCGEPLVREPAYRYLRNRYGHWHQYPDGERWTYHFGRYQFMQIVTIRDGVITRIENGPRG
ncbi:hypothetical protein C7H85_17865 [Zobellella endophytica]|uniref:DUF2845 domain-containing protein n=2 Tax=Zobellella endophytica TaxID=2116700 RepID=A0A2P7QTQ1_9GAMM|nr:DUF2845 domain-containing protein [Zobellella endophytica]PSJ41346.1 hypothetical protein C7H85_17865 [Zobellella endophytica]